MGGSVPCSSGISDVSSTSVLVEGAGVEEASSFLEIAVEGESSIWEAETW